jgi:beta-glucosidase
MRSLAFPKKFVWGVAMAAPQIEGASFTDGKGPSIWDTFSRIPGKIRNGDTLDIACDHYHRYRDDFALMAKLGVKNYRLSLAWPRIIPQGRGAVNQAGLDHYRRLLDTLLDYGITPWVTMFHWDLPQALEDQGGWRVRKTVDAFALYADLVVKTFGDQVKNWITLNEIFCITTLGHGGGSKAPGTSESPAVLNQTYHHAILCHGHGVRAVREHGQRGSRVGLSEVSVVPIPVTDTPRDIAAAQKTFVASHIRVLDPIYRGRYATDYLREAGRSAPKVHRNDFDLISLPTDFLGLNIYTGSFVRAGKHGRPEVLPLPAGYPSSDCTWLKFMPQALHWGPRHAAEIYKVKSIYITENGVGYNEPPPVDGELFDLHRRDYLRNYLRELQHAIALGVPVKGYFLWSFLDNFEWEDGYERRFGIIHTDFATQVRTPKLSAHWYARVMAENRIV